MNIILIIKNDELSKYIILTISIGNIHILIKLKADSSHYWKLVGGNTGDKLNPYWLPTVVRSQSACSVHVMKWVLKL